MRVSIFYKPKGVLLPLLFVSLLIFQNQSDAAQSSIAEFKEHFSIENVEYMKSVISYVEADGDDFYLSLSRFPYENTEIIHYNSQSKTLDLLDAKVPGAFEATFIEGSLFLNAQDLDTLGPYKSLISLDLSTGRIQDLSLSFEHCFFFRSKEHCSSLRMDRIKPYSEHKMFLANAGGSMNVQYSLDQGNSWVPLLGEMQQTMCYRSAFEMVGRNIVIGGECPLDMAYLMTAEVFDGQGAVIGEPFLKKVEIKGDLQNRKIQFIRHIKETGEIFAGAEGALLYTKNISLPWEFIYTDGMSGGGDSSYPYVRHLIHGTVANRDLIILGGNRNAPENRGVMKLSLDMGEHWHDLSEILADHNGERGTLHEMYKDSRGRYILVFDDVAGKRLRVGELKLKI